MLQRRCSLDAVVLADVALPAFGFVVSKDLRSASPSPFPFPFPVPHRWSCAPYGIGVRASAKTDYSSRTCFDKQQFKTWCYFWFTPRTEYVTYTQYVYVIRHPSFQQTPKQSQGEAARTPKASAELNKRLTAEGEWGWGGDRESWLQGEYRVVSACNFICLHI